MATSGKGTSTIELEELTSGKVTCAEEPGAQTSGKEPVTETAKLTTDTEIDDNQDNL